MQVMIYFNSKLFRGNRCVKNSSTSLDAFSTPNIPPLAILETDINSECGCSASYTLSVHSVHTIRSLAFRDEHLRF